MDDLQEIKRDLFFSLLESAGRVFVHIRPSMELEIGRRGLVGDEINDGITLVFNSHMKFDWDDYGIEATLVFGTTPEKCFIPADAIDAVYSPELKVQLIMEAGVELPEQKGKAKAEAQHHPLPVKKEDGNVIEVDFSKKQH